MAFFNVINMHFLLSISEKLSRCLRPWFNSELRQTAWILSHSVEKLADCSNTYFLRVNAVLCYTLFSTAIRHTNPIHNDELGLDDPERRRDSVHGKAEQPAVHKRR